MKHIKILILLFLIFSGFCVKAESPEYLALVDSADNYMRRERWQDAENVIERAMRLEPGSFSNSMLFSNLGVARTHLKRYDDALEAFRLGLSIAPGSSTLRNNRATTLMYLGKYHAALNDLDESLEIDSLQEWPRRMRGLLRLGINDVEGARADLTKAVVLFPPNGSTLGALARVEMREGHASEALTLFDKAIALDDNPESRLERILLKIAMKRYTEAREDIAESMQKYPDDGDFFVARGYLHLLNYRYEEAEIDKKIALEKGVDAQFVERFIPDTRR